MNLRRITLKYMGWCPGVDNAARFIPDYDVPLKPWMLFVSVVGITILYLVGQPSFNVRYPPYEEGPLKVYVGQGTDREVIYDRDINETFDYFQLYKYDWRGPAYFVEKLDDSEYAEARMATETIYFYSLEELFEYLRGDLKAPNVVWGLVRSLLEHTWEEFAVEAGYGSTKKGASTINIGRVYQTQSWGWGINYGVLRLKDVNWVTDELYVQDGLYVGKYTGERIVWEFRIDAAEFYLKDFFHIESPRYKVQVLRYPPGTKLWFRP